MELATWARLQSPSCFKDGAAILGLEKPEDFYPHSLRSLFITQLVNDDLCSYL